MQTNEYRDSRAQKSGRRPHSAPSGAVGWPNSLINEWLRERIAAAGGDPKIVPDEPFRILRLPEVEAKTGITRSSIYRRIEAQAFPKPLRLDAREGRPANIAA